MRHQSGIVEDHIDSAVGLHRMIDQAPDLIALRHIGLHGGAIAEDKLFGERLQPFDAPRAEHEPCAILGEAARGGFTQSAARAGDDDDLVGNARSHGNSL